MKKNIMQKPQTRAGMVKAPMQTKTACKAEIAKGKDLRSQPSGGPKATGSL